MRTLDELIEDMTVVQSLYEIGRRQDYETVADALHYLREYKAILPLVPSLINTALEVQKKGKTIG